MHHNLGKTWPVQRQYYLFHENQYISIRICGRHFHRVLKTCFANHISLFTSNNSSSMSAQLHGSSGTPFDDESLTAHINNPHNVIHSTSDSMTDDANDVDMTSNDNEEEIDYFGDYNTSTIDTEISNGPLYNPHTVKNGNTSPNDHHFNKHDAGNNNNNNSSTNTLDYDAAYNDYINDGKPKKKRDRDRYRDRHRDRHRYRPFYNHNRDRDSRSKYNQSYRKRRCMFIPDCS